MNDCIWSMAEKKSDCMMYWTACASLDLQYYAKLTDVPPFVKHFFFLRIPNTQEIAIM